jgi:hypothetical protein
VYVTGRSWVTSAYRWSSSLVRTTEGSDNMKPNAADCTPSLPLVCNAPHETAVHRPFSSAIEVVTEDDDA